jgi:hypothetical protein
MNTLEGSRLTIKGALLRSEAKPANAPLVENLLLQRTNRGAPLSATFGHK